VSNTEYESAGKTKVTQPSKQGGDISNEPMGSGAPKSSNSGVGSSERARLFD
jgi:hypothetical protein